MNENFKILNEFKGFGEPFGKIWFIGIEESGVWSDDPNEFQKEIKSYSCKGGFKFNNGSNSLKTPVYVIISKIMSGLNGKGFDWREYRKICLFRPKTDVFQMNLYPLGKKNVGDWPAHYKSLFSYGKEDYERYISDVKELRFPKLRKFWHEKSPQITICFGKTYWSDFKELLDLDGRPESHKDGSIQLYRGEKVVLTPFFGNGQMGEDRIQTLVRILKDMIVQTKIKTASI